MNREIKFRGKGIEKYDKDKWYYGSYFIYNVINYFFLDDGSKTEEINEKIRNNIKHKIIFEVQGDLNMENHIKLADVNPETVGQFTGLYDKNGKEIYEGDIIHINDEFLNEFNYLIEWNEEYLRYYLYSVDKEKLNKLGGILEAHLNSLEVEIISNIYDNPELLGGE